MRWIASKTQDAVVEIWFEDGIGWFEVFEIIDGDHNSLGRTPRNNPGENLLVTVPKFDDERVLEAVAIAADPEGHARTVYHRVTQGYATLPADDGVDPLNGTQSPYGSLKFDDQAQNNVASSYYFKVSFQ